jgi:hypothetical protein
VSRSARTPDEILRVYRRLTAVVGPEVAESWITAKGYPQAAEAARTARKKAAKKARETARLGRLITESLTAAQAPQAAPGAGAAPGSAAPQNGEFSAFGAGQESPFWRLPSAEPVTAPVPEKPLHEMGIDELRAHSARTFSAHGRSQGFRSPSWQ